MVDPTELRDLSPDRFGAVVAAVVEGAWEGDVDVSPPSPDGSADAVIRDGGGSQLLRVHQSGPIDADAVHDASRLATERGYYSVTLVTADTVTASAREAARETGVEVVDGESFAALVDEADVPAAPTDQPPVATVVSQVAGHWPERLREVAVELATTIEETVAADVELTRGTHRTDVDFRARVDGRVVARLRLTRSSLLVYVRRDGALESVIRLTAHRDTQPSVRSLLADLRAVLSTVVEE